MRIHSGGWNTAYESCRSVTNCTPQRIQRHLLEMKILFVAALFAGVGFLQSSKLLANEQAQENHIVASRFEAGPTDGELTLIFTVNPGIRNLPSVRWLRAAGGDTKTLNVKKDLKGRYTAVLGDVSHAIDGQVLIDLSDSKAGTHELHSADFALREPVTKGPSMSPSRDGHFVVYTKPTDTSPVVRLLISSSEQPIDGLPTGISNRDVVGAYSLTFLTPNDTTKDWQLTMANPTNGKLALFYLAKSGTQWKPLKSTFVEGRPFLAAAIAGPGTYMLVQEVKR